MEDKYNNLIKLYENYKEILIDDNFKTIKKFVKFSEVNNEKIYEKTDISNFIESFYIILKEKTTNEKLRISREERTIILIKLCFIMLTIERNDFKQNHLEQLMIKTLDYYSEKLILFNQDFFNLKIHKIIKYGLQLNNFIIFLSNQINLDNKKILLKNFFIISNFLIMINKNKNELISTKIIDQIIIPFDWKKFTSLNMYFNNDIKKILSNEFAIDRIVEIKNNFLYIFNNIIYNLKIFQSQEFNIILLNCVGEFVDIVCNSNNSNDIILEDYYLILQELIEFCFSLTDDNLKETDSKLLKLISNVFTSNNNTLHKLTKFFYESKIKKLNTKEDHISFIDNILSIFDVLETFNTHLVKSLNKELEAIIIFCCKFEYAGYNKILKVYPFSENENLTLNNIFKNPLNHFNILAKKILNHDNTRVKKYFVKFFCKLKGINNNLRGFVFGSFFKLISIPSFYSEADNTTYHSKIGILIQNFFESYLESNKQNIDEYLTQYLVSIETIIKNKYIFVYLINVILTLIERGIITSDLVLNNQMVSSLCKIIEVNIKMVTIYHKNLCWKSVLKLIAVCKKTDVNMEKKVILLNLVLKNLFNETINLKYISNDKKITNIFILFSGLFTEDQLLIKETKKSCKIELSNYFEYENLGFENNMNMFWFKVFNFLLIHNKDNFSVEEIFFFFEVVCEQIVKVFSNLYMNQEEKHHIVCNMNVIFNYLNYILQFELIQVHNIKLIFDMLSKAFCECLFYLFDEFKSDAIVYNQIEVNFYKNFEKSTIKKEILNSLEKYMLLLSRFKLFELDFNKEIIGIISRNLSHISEIKIPSNKPLYENQKDIIYLDKLLQYIDFILNLYTTYKLFLIDSEKRKSESFEEILNMDFLLDFLKRIIHNNDKIDKIEKSLNLERNDKIFNNIILNLIKIFCFLSQMKNVNLFNNSYLSIDFIIENLEKRNEDDLHFIFIYTHNYISHIHDKKIDVNFVFFEQYITNSINTLKEKKENMSYLNINSFLQGFLSKKAFEFFSGHSKGVEILILLFEKIFELNKNKFHIFLRIACTMILEHLINYPELFFNLDVILINLSESRECRGEDSYLLESSPQFLIPPFNLKKEGHFSFLNEEANKHGLFVRTNLLIAFENIINKIDNYYRLEKKDIKNKQSSIENYIILIFMLIQKTIEVIDKNSSSKIEMIFSFKHRKKLRIGQFLILLSKVFQICTENYDNLSDNIKKELMNLSNNIHKTSISLFDKINLASVRFYLDSFYMNYSLINKNFIGLIVDKLGNPLTKPNIVTSCLIISSMLLLKYHKNFKKEIIQSIYGNLLSSCTSSVCNIRGYAQFFTLKISKIDENFLNQSNNFLQTNFISYLNKNPNISKFFAKFNHIFENFMNQFNDISVLKILQSNIDEIYSEIIPIDLFHELKTMATKLVPIENEDMTKNYISWRYFVDDEEKTDIYRKFESKTLDFQRKYNPEFSIITQEDNFSKRKRLDIIIMASFIDKAPNLGGLARTCEVFNLGSMTVGSESYITDPGFIAAASSAEKWLPITVLAICDIEKFILSYKKLGYSIVGLEQTANSIPLGNYNFKEKTVIILGNERSGIPQNLIKIIDNCVIIPQFGNIRSLNVHVSAALMIWTIVNCIQIPNKIK